MHTAGAQERVKLLHACTSPPTHASAERESAFGVCACVRASVHACERPCGAAINNARAAGE